MALPSSFAKGATALISLPLLWLSTPVRAEDASAAVSTAFEALVEPPQGFDNLTDPRESVVDLYFGGRQVGEARIQSRPGRVRFREPDKVVAQIPNLEESAALRSALMQELESNAELVCSSLKTGACGTLTPDVAAVILNEDSFRIDLFVNPQLLKPVLPVKERYLPEPTSFLSLTNALGLAASGSTGTAHSYNLQARTIASWRNARVRSNNSYASGLGLVVDDLVAEIDRPDLRYSAGMMWTPGIDLIGQRRLLGFGLQTQLDTRADREILQATPLFLFLQRPSRVDLIVDGRIVASRMYEAGNNLMDTAALAHGSYPLRLDIHESGGGSRVERRFFVKSSQIAPQGQSLYHAYVGALANTRRGRPFGTSGQLYFNVGAARRVNQSLAVDFSALGTQKKFIGQFGSHLILPAARFRAAGLISSSADFGALLQASSSGRGPLNFAFDLRRVWSRTGAPLLPASARFEGFDPNFPADTPTDATSLTQASGSISYHLGSAYLNLIASFRKDSKVADYSIGPSVSWPVIQRARLQLVLQGDIHRTRNATAAFVGVRALLSRPNGLSLLGGVGRASIKNRSQSGASGSRIIGSVGAQWDRQLTDSSQLNLAADFDRSVDATTGHVGGALYSSKGSVRGDVLHNLQSGQRRTQYGFTIQTGAAILPGTVSLGGRDIAESALIVSLEGYQGTGRFEVLVDESPKAELKSGSSVPLFLQPYRQYNIRLRGVDAAHGSFDPAPRRITLLPGNVQQVRWSVERTLTVWGHALRADGTALSDATVHSRRGLGETDGDGFFQIEVETNDGLTFLDRQGSSCSVTLSHFAPRKEYASLGKVTCH